MLTAYFYLCILEKITQKSKPLYIEKENRESYSREVSVGWQRAVRIKC